MKNKVINKTEEQIIERINPLLIKLGYSLVDIVFINQKKTKKITLYVFKDENMSVDDLALLSKEIDETITSIDFLSEGYLLEVSSPGINRIIKSSKEFDIFKGKEIKVILNDGAIIIGECCGTIENALTLSIQNERKRISIGDIASAKLFG